MTASCFHVPNIICAAACVKSAAISSTNWIYALGYFQGPIIYPLNTSSCISVNTGCSSNWALTMAFKPDGCVHTNTTNNWGGLRSGNVTVGYGGSYNTVENIVSGQQLHLRTSNSANIQIGDSGSTCTFICNCVQSPILCATNYVQASNVLCTAGCARIGKLYIPGSNCTYSGDGAIKIFNPHGGYESTYVDSGNTGQAHLTWKAKAATDAEYTWMLRYSHGGTKGMPQF